MRCQEERTQMHDHALAILTEYSDVQDTHELLHADLCLHETLSIDDALAALSDGSFEPELEPDDEPTWAQALASPDCEYWIAGGRDELKSLEDLNIFVLIPQSEVPHGHHPLKGKLVCKRKHDDAGKVVHYKVCYVAKGYAQHWGINYDKTTTPTVHLESFCSILHIGATLDWDLQHFDIKTAFLHGILPEDKMMFMEQPQGFEEPRKEDWVMRLMKSIYGMKQASQIWNQTFHNAMVSWGFECLSCDWCVYRCQSPLSTIIFAVHIDGIILAASSPDENSWFKAKLKAQWDISDLGPAKFTLGIAITCDHSNHLITLSQIAKIDHLVEQYHQSDVHPVDTPMVTGLQLRRPDKNLPTPPKVSEWAECTPYRSLVGSLMYLAVATRLDIAYAVGRLASFMDCYQPNHWAAAICVLCYLKGTRLYSLTLGGQNSLSLSGYSDSDYANCMDTSCSVGGYLSAKWT